MPPGAGAAAAAAAGTEELAEAGGVDRELVEDPLPVPGVLDRHEVVPGSVEREAGRLAGVPVAAARPARHPSGLVDDVEAVTGGAGGGAGPAAVAAEGDPVPDGVVEMASEPGRHRSQGADRLDPPSEDGGAALRDVGLVGRVAEAARVGGDERLPFGVTTSTAKPSSGDEEEVGAARPAGPFPVAPQKHEASPLPQATETIVVASRRPNQSSSR